MPLPFAGAMHFPLPLPLPQPLPCTGAEIYLSLYLSFYPLQDVGSVYGLMGEDKGTYWMRKRRQEEQQHQNAFMGKDIAVAVAGKNSSKFQGLNKQYVFLHPVLCIRFFYSPMLR
jgi:hypothetical protein